MMLAASTLARASQPGLRLVEVNETTRLWLPQEEVLKRFQECGGDKDHPGFIDVTDHPNLRPQPWQAQLTSFSANTSSAAAERAWEKVYASVALRGGKDQIVKSIKDTVDSLVSFGSRYYTLQSSVEAANWIKTQFEQAATGRSFVSVELFPHTWAQPSVIATVRGSQYPDEYVVIGCHEDSTSSNNNNAPGADDDASGVASVLEAFRTFIANPQFQPKRTVQFMAYAAEEVGLRGSQAIASDYQSKGTKVVGMLQLDMTMYVGRSGNVGVVTDFTNAGTTALVRDLVDKSTTLTRSDSTCGYGCSDHASWTRAGYPSAFVFETPFGEHNPSIHTPQDTQDKLDFDKGTEFAKLAAAFGTLLGDP